MRPRQAAPTQDKLPPHDTDAEDAIIGSILIAGSDEECMQGLWGTLAPDDFFSERNKWIYEAALTIYRRNEGLNEITIARELAQTEKLEKIGGAAYLAHLISIVPTPYHAQYYSGIVSRLALCRQMISAGAEITRIGFQAEPDIVESLTRIRNTIELLDRMYERMANKPLPVVPGSPKRLMEVAHD